MKRFGSVVIDSANWMAHLPPSLSSTPLHMLAIPGSHDSCSYSLSSVNDISPDETNLLVINKLRWFGRIPKIFVRRWSATQNLTLTQQLQAGVRYFDMRLAPHSKKKTLHIVHGLYGIEIQDALREMSKFLHTHPKEIIVIHFQHFYEFTPEMHERLINDIVNIFGISLCPLHFHLTRLTLDFLWAKKFQVIVLYKYKTVYDAGVHVWPDTCIFYPWPNKDNVSDVIAFLKARYIAGRPSNKFNIVQGVLTPSGQLISRYFYSSLAKRTREMNSALSSFIREKYPEKLNIIMVDFVNVAMSKNIINVNYK